MSSTTQDIERAKHAGTTSHLKFSHALLLLCGRGLERLPLLLQLHLRSLELATQLLQLGLQLAAVLHSAVKLLPGFNRSCMCLVCPRRSPLQIS